MVYDILAVHFVSSLDYFVGNMRTYITVPCLLAFATVALANPPMSWQQLPLVPIATIDRIPNPSYHFNYAVNDPSTGDNKGQWETREGDVVRGAYSLVEPDGNIRLVEYTSDPHTGFNAVVKRTRPNVHSVSLPIASHITPVMTKPIAPVSPVVPLDYSYAPIADLSHEPIAPVIAPSPVGHGPIITPLIETPQIIPYPSYGYYPIAPVRDLSPWITLSGRSYSGKGNIVRRWTSGPISMAGKTLTIRTKHH